MTYCRNFCSMLIVFLGISWIGCGEDVPTEPGEEIVTDKWIDPKDIGKEYSVPELDFGDTVTIETGERVTLTKNDFILFKDRRGYSEQQPFLVTTKLKPDPLQGEGWFIRERTERGFVVPEGPPIVYLVDTSGLEVRITGENNIRGTGFIGDMPNVHIDRVLDYNLPIYVEFQLQKRDEVGGEVTRTRFLLVVPKGETQAFGFAGYWDLNGEPKERLQTSFSVLPHTEMKKIDLPAKVGISAERFDDVNLPLEDKVIPEGHTFRPYRIASSSFFMASQTFESNW